MALATLKEKGQITLPANIRKRIHADAGDLFDCDVVDGKVIMTPQKVVPATTRSRPQKKKGVDISKYMGIASGNFGSAEEIDEYIRNERASWNR